MDNDGLFKLTCLIFLIICSGFFSSAETSLMACNKIRIQTLADAGIKKAILVTKILNNQSKMISTILIGNNIANIGASSLATSLTLDYIGSYAVSITAGILTLVVLVFGEILPKNVATIHANAISMMYAPIIFLLMKVLTPLVYFVNKVSSLLIKIFRLHGKNDATITEQEFKALVDVGEKEGILEQEEKEIINNLLEFTDAKAKEVMTPRIDMIFININETYESIVETFKTHKFTRLPVYDDTKDEVIGILNIKDLLINDINDFKLSDNIRDPYFTYENKNVGDLLVEMRQGSINIAIVLDEYGITSGLITLEDLLEELVGEIRDEYDDDELDDIVKNADNSYTIDGMTKLDIINTFFNLNLSGEGYDNIAGYINEELDHIPNENESIICKNIKFTVSRVENNRIISIIAKNINNNT